ncbi:hypothetical protein V8E55_003149 [Tylopilus felleus]
MQIGLVKHTEDIRSIALSPDDASLAIGGVNGTITIKSQSRRTDLFSISVLHLTLQEPDIQINHAALDAWKHDRFEDADALLTTAILGSQNQNNGLLAARALLRARLQHWDDALVDANTVIKIQPSVIAYIAKGLAHVGKGDKDMAYRACDIAFEHFHSSHVTLLLLTKAIIVFMAGEHRDAISRMDDLIATVPSNSTCYVVQAYMYLIQGNTHAERNNYQSAIQSFEHARARLPSYWHPPPLVMSGWEFDNLHFTIRQRLCEALYAGGRKKVARESLLEMVNTFCEEVYTTEPITKWVSLSRAGLDTLVFKFVVARFMVYGAICERLETIDRTMEASECFRQMVDELVDRENAPPEQAEWVTEFRRRCIQKLETLADTVTRDKRHDDAISHYSAALSLKPAAPQTLLIKRSKAYLAKERH